MKRVYGCDEERQYVRREEGRFIREAAHREGYTGHQLAEMLGMTDSSLSYRLSGRFAFTRKHMDILAEPLGLDVDSLLSLRRDWQKTFPNSKFCHAPAWNGGGK